MVGTLVDDAIARHRRAERVEVHLAVVIGLRQLSPGRRRGEAAVVEAPAVARELRLVVLDVRQLVGEVLARRDVAHVPHVPVAAAERHAVRELRSIFRGIPAAERELAVR